MEMEAPLDGLLRVLSIWKGEISNIKVFKKAYNESVSICLWKYQNRFQNQVSRIFSIPIPYWSGLVIFKQSGRIPTRELPHPFFKGKALGTRLRDDRTSLAKPEIEWRLHVTVPAKITLVFHGYITIISVIYSNYPGLKAKISITFIVRSNKI